MVVRQKYIYQRNFKLKILLVDLHNMIHRARHSFIKGENACVFNFFRQLKAEIDRHQPDTVYLVSEGRPKHRHALYDSYKANRPKKIDDDFSKQKKKIYELVQLLPVNFIYHPDFECDDVIAYLASEVYCDCDVTILSTDTDFIQLLQHEHVSLWNPIKKKYIDQWPVDYLTYKSLRGDAADNIKGVTGVGDKTAMKLASEQSMLMEFFDKKPDAKTQYTQARDLIKFANVAKYKSGLVFKIYNMDMDKMFSAFKEMNFKSLTGKSWPKWTSTMEKISESRSQRNHAESVG